jgi:2-hydroxychromene-2-carboxylate isomerase
MLTTREKEESSSIAGLQAKITLLKASIHENEDLVIIQERAFESFTYECQQIVADAKSYGEKKISLAKTELLSLKKELNHLIATHPQRVNERNKELNELKAMYADEIRLAQAKVAAMLDKKRSLVEDASAKLLRLQNDIAEIERQIDEARSRKIWGSLQPM